MRVNYKQLQQRSCTVKLFMPPTAGSWIKLMFNGPHAINLLKYMDRSSVVERNKDIKLEFSDGSETTVTLQNGNHRIANAK